MSPAVVERADPFIRLFDYLEEHLSPSEFEAFGQEVTEATRPTGGPSLRRVVESWLVTVQVREDPTYRPQVEAFETAVKSGALFEQSPLAGMSLPPAI